MKVLCTGDVHIGRRSSRVPTHLDPDGRRFTCASAWEAIVDLAIEQRVGLVIISGDLVDQENRFFEAVGVVERGLRRLADADIDTVAVAGNHDWQVLPRIADGTAESRFHLLGQQGRWERQTITRTNGERLHIDGWSFPSQYVAAHPLEDMLQPPDDGAPRIAVLHGDLDSVGSVYNPLPRVHLQRSPVSFWLLGHIHRPQWIPPTGGGPGILYPGSPFALDPDEREAHGVWLGDISPEREIELQQISISRVRYAHLPLDLSGIETRDAFDPHLVHAIRSDLQKQTLDGSVDHLECISYRIVLTGRTRLHNEIRTIIKTACQDLDIRSDRVAAAIDKVIIETQPALDLEELASGTGLASELARLILSLSGAKDVWSAEVRTLVADAQEAMRRVAKCNAYARHAPDDDPDPEAALLHLLRESWALLDALMSQKEAAA